MKLKNDNQIIDTLRDWRLADLLPEAVSQEIATCIGAYKYKRLKEIYEEYKHLESEDQEIKEVTPKPKNILPLVLYKKLTKVLKYEMLKESVLIKHNYTCFCCEEKFDPREKAIYKKYPLLVRCNFPIVKYIEMKDYKDVKELIKDTKIFNSDNFLPICNDCKPASFGKTK